MTYLSIEVCTAVPEGRCGSRLEAAVEYQNEVVVIIVNAPVPDDLEVHP
jgi:hypothetical protein